MDSIKEKFKKRRKLKNRVILLCTVLFFSGKFHVIAQNNVDSSLKISQVILVDTLHFDQPVVIRYLEKNAQGADLIQYVLIPDVKDTDTYLNLNLASALSNNAFLFIEPRRFSCILSNEMVSGSNHDQPALTKLENQLRNAENDTIWSFVDKTKQTGKDRAIAEVRAIFPRKFQLVLVSSEAINDCITLDYIRLKYDGPLYIPTVVPVK